jgi:hypothetical protein
VAISQQRCYEANATVVMEPGKFARGETAIKIFMEATIALPITFGQRAIVRSGRHRIALLAMDDPSRRWLRDFRWIDNPWGSSLLDGKTAP